jgi:2-deoxy-D-gluconate 3-dehydrogenase
VTLDLGGVGFDFTGRAAIVTGAGRGIGRAITQALLAAGARVAGVTLTERSAADLAQVDRTGQSLVPISGDASQSEVAAHAVATALDRFGRLDMLVNNAGGVLKRAPVSQWSAEEWDRVQAVNTRSAFVFCRAAEDALRAAAPSYVVNVASLSGFIGHWSAAAYAASKGGVGQLTKSLACEWAAHGIRVNAVAPGFIETDANADLRRDDPELVSRLRARIPAGRWGVPDDLVGPVLFLCSPAAAYLSGVILPVDGGVLAA